MTKNKVMTYLMEAPMHAYPCYSAILLALALSLPAVYAQEMPDVEIEEEEPAAVRGRGQVPRVPFLHAARLPRAPLQGQEGVHRRYALCRLRRLRAEVRL